MSPHDTPALLTARLCDFYGYGHAVLFGRARGALVALADVLGLAGRAAVIPSNVCPVVAVALLAAGTVLRLAPVDPGSGLAEDDRLAHAIAGRSDAGLVMPTHLYGQLGRYERTRAMAGRDGWFVLENDTLCAARVRHGRRYAFGDALVTSFGDGKTASAGGGGALLTDDAALATELQRIVDRWAPPGADAEAVDLHSMQVRRHLRALGLAGLAEGLLPIEQTQLRHAFAPTRAAAVLAALDRVEATLAQRACTVAAWDEALAPLGEELTPLPWALTAPWRLIRRVARPAQRDGLANALRAEGFDAGINFPALSESFPSRLGGQAHVDADTWSERVLNLWLDDAITPARMQQAAHCLTRQLAMSTPLPAPAPAPAPAPRLTA